MRKNTSSRIRRNKKCKLVFWSNRINLKHCSILLDLNTNIDYLDYQQKTPKYFRDSPKPWESFLNMGYKAEAEWVDTIKTYKYQKQ